MDLDVARFQHALPAGQNLVNDLDRIDAVVAKASRWQLTSIVPSAADIVDNAEKNLFHSALNRTHCLHNMLPSQKLFTVAVYASKDMVEYYPWQKPNVISTASSSGVHIAMLSTSYALC